MKNVYFLMLITISLMISSHSLTAQLRLDVDGAMKATQGGTLQSIVIGQDGTNVDYPNEYETIGVNSSGLVLRLQSPRDIRFHTNITDNEPAQDDSKVRMIIKESGNIGIGTLDPQAKLDVAGGGKMRGRFDLASGDFRSVAIGNETSLNGQQNTFVGYQAGKATSAGTVSVSTYIGDRAGTNSSTGQQNVALGSKAGEAITTGGFNVYVGTFTGSAGGLSTASFNTFVGYNVQSFTGNDNSTALGSNTVVNTTNSVVLGNVAQSQIGGYVNFSSLSDRRFKSNIKEDVQGLDFILNLRPVTYQVDAVQLDKFVRKGIKDDEQVNRTGYLNALNEQSKITYTGFLAQEVEQAAKTANFNFSGVIAPQNQNDHYRLRYAEFVVPMVKAIQEQQEKIESQENSISEKDALLTAMQARLDEQENRLKKLEELLLASENSLNTPTNTSLNQQSIALSTATLQQNQPNPFNGQTTIQYFLPESAQTAQIQINDQNGRVLKVETLQGNGHGQITLDAKALPQGTYSYSLFVDGQLVETKQMILAK